MYKKESSQNDNFVEATYFVDALPIKNDSNFDKIAEAKSEPKALNGDNDLRAYTESKSKKSSKNKIIKEKITIIVQFLPAAP